MRTALTGSSKPRARITARISGPGHTEAGSCTEPCGGLAGADDNRFRLRAVCAGAFVLLAGAALLPGCAGDDHSAPDALMDGSPAREAPVELDGVDEPTVLTAVDLADVPGDRGSRPETCLRGRGLRADNPAVERIGVTSETVTFRDRSGRAVFGCDDSLGPEEEGRRWCGGNYGMLYDGQLRDPASILVASPSTASRWRIVGATRRGREIHRGCTTGIHGGVRSGRRSSRSHRDDHRRRDRREPCELRRLRARRRRSLLREYELEAGVAG